MSDASRSEEDAMQELPPDTLAALLTGALAIRLGEAVSALVGKAYTARSYGLNPGRTGGPKSSSSLCRVPARRY